ncbi:hypothetical protein B0O99DRAFT_736270 [Bisporella sp. PMI_857]|nr:hypothetical protein B0O99DRAFT_736270 [Bisporella sp. PMI_857]
MESASLNKTFDVGGPDIPDMENQRLMKKIFPHWVEYVKLLDSIKDLEKQRLEIGSYTHMQTKDIKLLTKETLFQLKIQEVNQARRLLHIQNQIEEHRKQASKFKPRAGLPHYSGNSKKARALRMGELVMSREMRWDKDTEDENDDSDDDNSSSDADSTSNQVDLLKPEAQTGEQYFPPTKENPPSVSEPQESLNLEFVLFINTEDCVRSFVQHANLDNAETKQWWTESELENTEYFQAKRKSTHIAEARIQCDDYMRAKIKYAFGNRIGEECNIAADSRSPEPFRVVHDGPQPANMSHFGHIGEKNLSSQLSNSTSRDEERQSISSQINQSQLINIIEEIGYKPSSLYQPVFNNESRKEEVQAAWDRYLITAQADRERRLQPILTEDRFQNQKPVVSPINTTIQQEVDGVADWEAILCNSESGSGLTSRGDVLLSLNPNSSLSSAQAEKNGRPMANGCMDCGDVDCKKLICFGKPDEKPMPMNEAAAAVKGNGVLQKLSTPTANILNGTTVQKLSTPNGTAQTRSITAKIQAFSATTSRRHPIDETLTSSPLKQATIRRSPRTKELNSDEDIWCKHCRKEGHVEISCWYRYPETRPKWLNGPCSNCGILGHNRDHCWKRFPQARASTSEVTAGVRRTSIR